MFGIGTDHRPFLNFGIGIGLRTMCLVRMFLVRKIRAYKSSTTVYITTTAYITVNLLKLVVLEVSKT